MSTTYLPAHFEETRLPVLQGLVDAHPLATWATLTGGELAVHHVPFLLDRTRGPFGTLVGHVARANPVWRELQRSVFVFQGPDAYVSPGWYASKAYAYGMNPLNSLGKARIDARHDRGAGTDAAGTGRSSGGAGWTWSPAG